MEWKKEICMIGTRQVNDPWSQDAGFEPSRAIFHVLRAKKPRPFHWADHSNTIVEFISCDAGVQTMYYGIKGQGGEEQDTILGEDGD